jgi:HEAT repeat protein
MKKSHLTPLLWIVLLLIPATVLIKLMSFPAPTQDNDQGTPQKPAPAPAAIMPDLPRLAAQANKKAPARSTEAVEEEKRVIQEQVEAARVWLNDANPEQRLTGAEQLSAYPTPEAEKLLSEALSRDPAPSVRAAAAQSLKFFKRVQVDTLQILLAALEDADEEVRFTAQKTLQRQYSRMRKKPSEAKALLENFRKQAESPRVSKETKASIMDFVHDRE